MKKYSVEISNKARMQYLRIYDYIKNELKSLKSATRLMELIDSKIQSLDTLPNMYTRVKGLTPKSLLLRYVTANNFNIIYTVNDEKKLVTVLAIVYCKGDKNIL